MTVASLGRTDSAVTAQPVTGLKDARKLCDALSKIYSSAVRPKSNHKGELKMNYHEVTIQFEGMFIVSLNTTVNPARFEVRALDAKDHTFTIDVSKITDGHSEPLSTDRHRTGRQYRSSDIKLKLRPIFFIRQRQ